MKYSEGTSPSLSMTVPQEDCGGMLLFLRQNAMKLKFQPELAFDIVFFF